MGGVSFATGSGSSLSLAGGGGFGFGGGGGTKFWLRVHPYRMSRCILCQIVCLPTHDIKKGLHPRSWQSLSTVGYWSSNSVLVAVSLTR